MENDTIDDMEFDDRDSELGLTQNAVNDLDETRRWTRFLAILGFVMLGLIVISTLGGAARSFEYGGGIEVLLNIIVGVLYFFPILYLFRFSNHMQTALQVGQKKELENAFRNLKAHYRFVGVLTIVVMALVLVFIVIVRSRYW